ncbi:MAG TPA: pilus assembly protein PilM [Ruminococcus sp.]|nr:pilus assembly protein PilM [Ruminococcus sp.]
MLSFDITDRKIRIIKGTESGGKIKISSAAEISLDEAVIVNGHVNDINRVAVMINQVLKAQNMPDKEAIVSIASNQTVFKELLVTPNSKESEFMKEIRMQLQVQINVDDSYSVAYVIVGDPEEDETGERKQRVLVTACPYDVVDCYKRVFHMLGITLKTVMIGCNAITKVLLADSKVKAKMPLLAVQVDTDFISLNIYENNQLSFSRFASIDPEDYENPDDYVFEAVLENIERMLQFSRSRSAEEIENVVLYGDLNCSEGLYDRLVEELSGSSGDEDGLTVTQLTVPPQIHGYQSLEFALYANAIGAMFKRDKATERIDLLETETSTQARSTKVDDSSLIYGVIGLGVSLVCVVGVFAALTIMDNNTKNDTKKLRDFLDSPDTAAQLTLYDELQERKTKVNAYADAIDTASEAYKTHPILSREVYEAIDDALVSTATVENVGTVQESSAGSVNYEDGVFEIPVSVITKEEFSQKYPAAMVQYIYDNYSDMFENVNYTGYSAAQVVPEKGQTPDGSINVNFTLELTMKWNEAPVLEADDTTDDTAETEEVAAE